MKIKGLIVTAALALPLGAAGAAHAATFFPSQDDGIFGPASPNNSDGNG